jgi:choline trimethylamine-lyase
VNIPSRPNISSRLDTIRARRTQLNISHKRDLLCDNAEFLVYHWSGQSEAFAPATGEQAKGDRINIGDHNCRVDSGKPFPYTAEMPSKLGKLENTPENWAADYRFFITHSPAIIDPDELIVGDFHWQLDEARTFRYPEEVHQLGYQARKLGAGGISFTHTCPDLSIGLALGWNGLLQKIRENRARFEAYGNEDSAAYLRASEQVVLGIQEYIRSYAKKARELAQQEIKPETKAIYQQVAQCTEAIANDKPKNLHEAIQWIQLFQISERMHGHGNGYGRLDALLQPFYEADCAAQRITREEARSLVAELFLRYGNYFSLGGKNREQNDATNEMSWICLEAFDMVGGYNHLGVMWHSKIDKAFWRYACDVVGRYGAGCPTLVNYDIFRESELRSGYPESDAWNVSYSGCQWYCSPGNEYSDHDVNCLVLVQPLQRAIERVVSQGLDSFEDLWNCYNYEVNLTADALRDFKNATYSWQPKVWPEMVTSLCAHGPIEKGRDITNSRSVNNAYTSVNVLGVPNVSDSLYAIEQLVYVNKKYSLKELQAALKSDWAGLEKMRQEFLHVPKFGNDHSGADEMAVRVSEHIRIVLESRQNIKGFNFRPSLFQFMGHTYAGPMLGATPDGRLSREPLAHGMNPMHGRNSGGMTATIRSFCKLDFRKYQGGSLQIELQPNFFPQQQRRGDLVDPFATSFFQMGGVQINLNVIALEKLQRAMEEPDLPEHQEIVVKVTGYSAHFVVMDRKFQEEFVERVNYKRL